jgi:ABC-2 type transport system ATP-binding protein
MSDSAIRCRQLVKRYNSLTAVDRLDLDVRRGECFGLLGPNGAGDVEVLGCRWEGRHTRRLRARIGVALQETRLPEKLTVLEVVRLFRSFYRTGRTPDEVIAILGLDEKRNARVGKLSGGQRQRLALASALVASPELLFLDEPTTGLDPQARIRIWEVIEQFRAGGGTVFLTTHYMDEAYRLCNRVAIMDRGRGIALDTPDALIESLGAEQIIELPGDGLDADFFDALPGIVGIERRGAATRLRVNQVSGTLPALLARAAEKGIHLDSLATHRPTLEDVYVHLTGRGLRDG